MKRSEHLAKRKLVSFNRGRPFQRVHLDKHYLTDQCEESKISQHESLMNPNSSLGIFSAGQLLGILSAISFLAQFILPSTKS